MTIYHKHHIIPRHMGGTDDPDNLIELTVEEHAEAHRKLYEEHGRWQDKLAWKALSGQVSSAEISQIARKEAMKERWTEEAREEQRQKWTGERNPMYGKTTTQKQKDAVSKAMKGKKKNYAIKSNWPTKSGKDNPRSRKISAEGKIYDTIKSCCDAYGFKNHNTIRYRLNHEKWTDWFYVN